MTRQLLPLLSFLFLISFDTNAQCGLTVDAGEDQIACADGETVILNGNISGPYEDFWWSPPDNLSSTTVLSPEATVTGPFTYTLTATALSTVNLVVNGDFESGNSSFTTGYAPFDFSLPTEGEYLITDNPLSIIPPLSNCVDHTTGSGNMMVADGATTPGTSIWCQTITVNPNTDYEVGAWFLTHFVNAPTIQFTYNGVPGGTYSVPPQLCDWSEYTETWNSGGNTSVTLCLEDLNTGAIGNDIVIDDIYMYEVCEVTDEVDVMITDVHAEVADPIELTCDFPQVTLDGSGSSIGPGYTYLWTTFDGLIAGSTTSFITQAGAAGTYTLTVTDQAGCTDEFEVEVEGSNLPPDLNVTGGIISCDEPEITLSAFSSVDSVTYAWSGPDGFNSNEQEPLITEPGLYSITVTAPNGCESTQTVNVMGDSSIPELEVTGDTLTCDNPTGELESEADPPIGTYSWEGPDGFSSNAPNPAVSDTGTYILTFTDQNGCIATDTAIVIGATESPDVSLTADTLTCSEDTLFLSTGLMDDDLAFSWTGPDSFSSTEATVEVLIPGWYQVTVTNAGDCSTTDSVLISVDTTFSNLSIAGDTINCANSMTAELVPITDAMNPVFQWTGPGGFIEDDSVILVNAPGWYMLEVITPNGCGVIDSVEVLEDLVDPGIMALDDTLNCEDNQISLIVLSPDSIIFYKWSGPGGFISDEESPMVDVPGDYEVTITAENGCASIDTVSIIEDFQLPVFTLTGDTLGCTDGMVQIFSDITTNYASLQWTGPGNFMSSEEDPDVSQAGWYVLEVTGQNGCVAIDSVEVIEDGDIPDLSVMTDTITCTDPVANLVGMSQTTGVQFDWSGPDNFSASDPEVDVTTGGVYSLVLTAPNGCTASADLLVEVDTLLPSLVLSVDTITCNRNTVQITTSDSIGLANALWSGPNGFTANVFSPWVTEAGLYEIEYTGENGCTAIDQIQVEQDADVPTVMASGGRITCRDSVLTISASSSVGGSTYLWSGPNGFTSTDITPQVNMPGTYSVLVETPSGCEAQAQVTVTDSTQTPQISLTPASIPCDEVEAIINAQIIPAQADPTWSGPQNFTSTEANITVTREGWYVLEAVIPSTGCRETDSLFVEKDSLTITGLEYDIIDPDCGASNGIIDVFNIEGGDPPFTYSLASGSGQTNGLFENLTAGEYILSITDNSGCAYLDTLVLQGGSADFTVQLPDTIVIDEGQTINLDPSTDLLPNEISQVIWSPGVDLSCTDCLNPAANPGTTTLYIISLYDLAGCVQKDSTLILIREREEEDTGATIYVPNSFSPMNRDGINDNFTIFAAPGVIDAIEEMRVYNRWGDEMYVGEDFPPNNPLYGWDGTFRGQMMKPDVYVFWARLRLSNGSTRNISGDINILK